MGGIIFSFLAVFLFITGLFLFVEDLKSLRSTKKIYERIGAPLTLKENLGFSVQSRIVSFFEFFKRYTFVEKIEHSLKLTGINIPSGLFLLLSFIVGVIVFVGVSFLFTVRIFSLVFGASGILMTFVIIKLKKKKHMEKIRKQ
jgi:Flp pilus assembly protein TadB